MVGLRYWFPAMGCTAGAARLTILLFCGAAAGCNHSPRRPLATSTPDGSSAGDAERTDVADAHTGPDADADADADTDAGSPTRLIVNGTIVDPWGQPMSGWQVLLGGTTTATDANGRFTFSDVTPPYDVAFLSPGVSNTTAVPEVWQFRGLTRSNPTLQPIRAMGPHRGNLSVQRTNVPTPTTADGGQAPVALGISFGSPNYATGGVYSSLGGLGIGLTWSGTATLTGTMHGLAWTQPPISADGTVENVYLAYQAVPLTVTDEGVGSASQQVTLDFTANDVQTAPFKATLQSSWGEVGNPRTLHGLVVFDSNALIEVAEIRSSTSPATMTPTMPLLPGSHVVFVGFQSVGGAHGNMFGAAHREATAPEIPVVLDVPEPRTLSSPPEGTHGVGLGTTFQWSTAEVANIFSIACDAAAFRINVVTTENEVQLPSFPALGMSLPAGAACLWHVEVHGTHPSVDDATGPAGIADACFYDDNCERTSLRGNGSVTVSDTRAFQTAP
jgi:hypothetical protein